MCEIFDGCSRETLHAEHHKMNHTTMTPCQNPDEFLCIMNGCRDPLNTSIPPECPKDRQYEEILQALPPDCDSIERAHLERWDFDRDKFRRIMTVIYADNLYCRSITSAGIAGPSAAMKAMDRHLGEVQCHNCSMFGHSRRNFPNRFKQQYQDGQHEQKLEKRQRTRGRQQNKKEGNGGGIWCSYNKITIHRDADCRAQ